jgi:hypothetical protein
MNEMTVILIVKYFGIKKTLIRYLITWAPHYRVLNINGLKEVVTIGKFFIGVGIGLVLWEIGSWIVRFTRNKFLDIVLMTKQGEELDCATFNKYNLLDADQLNLIVPLEKEDDTD